MSKLSVVTFFSFFALSYTFNPSRLAIHKTKLSVSTSDVSLDKKNKNGPEEKEFNILDAFIGIPFATTQRMSLSGWTRTVQEQDIIPEEGTMMKSPAFKILDFIISIPLIHGN
jgi:hypothetical protein